MKIKNIQTTALSIPIDFGGKPAAFGQQDNWSALSTLLIRVETDTGVVGWGEAFSYNCLQSVKAAVDHMIAPAATGREVGNVSDLTQAIQRELHLFGRYGITMFAISGLDIALWDIVAKSNGQSVAQQIGSVQRQSVKAYASLFRYQDAEVVAEQCQNALAEGYELIKLHEITEVEVGAARDASGQTPLMVDTNCPWTVEQAIDMTHRLKEFDLFWLEEPIFPPEDFDGMATLHKETGVAIAAGENACTRHEFSKMLQANAVQYAQPSVTKVGGVSEFVAIGELCEASGVKMMPHSPYFGPGMLATLQLAAVQKSEPLLERFFGTVGASLFGKHIDPVDGVFAIPDGPGLGADPDPDVIKEFTVQI